MVMNSLHTQHSSRMAIAINFIHLHYCVSKSKPQNVCNWFIWHIFKCLSKYDDHFPIYFQLFLFFGVELLNNFSHIGKNIVWIEYESNEVENENPTTYSYHKKFHLNFTTSFWIINQVKCKLFSNTCEDGTIENSHECIWLYIGEGKINIVIFFLPALKLEAFISIHCIECDWIQVRALVKCSILFFFYK